MNASLVKELRYLAAQWRKSADRSPGREAEVYEECSDDLTYLTNTLAAREDVCEWTYDSDDRTEAWESSCGELYQFNDGGPVENNVRFCHACGKRVSPKLQDAAVKGEGE